MFTPWPHQSRTHAQTIEAIESGKVRICVQSPTGTGKTLLMAMLAKDFIERDKRVVLYTNRRLLLDQSSRNFSGFDLEHGVRAAGHEDQRWLPFQISSVQTEVTRLKNPERYRGWELHDADIVIVDEAHVNLGPEVRDILARHVNSGAAIVGYTATPIDMGQVYDHLIIGCTMKEGRESGALVPAIVYGPDEPDLKRMGIKLAGGDYTEGQQKKAIMTPTIFGRVFQWWNKLNPDHKPTVGFAPGVPESLYFAQEFWKKGITSAHIDGSDVWINGDRQFTSQEARDDILKAHEEGRIKILWNRFVLREGIDIKWAEYLILATIYGSVASYLQSVGRGLRSYPGKRIANIIDHGGNWHRFGSPNAEREWNLEYNSSTINGIRGEMLRKSGPEREPVRCPQCAMILATRTCPCGYVCQRTTWPRPVVQIDGTLKMIDSSLFRKRAVDTTDGGPKRWEKCYWIAYHSKTKMTFQQAIGLYQRDNFWKYPDSQWPFMPIETLDLFRRVCDVPRDRLRR